MKVRQPGGGGGYGRDMASVSRGLGGIQDRQAVFTDAKIYVLVLVASSY